MLLSAVKYMTKIPGYIYAFIGVIMVMFSYWIEQEAETNLIFFYVIGVGFIVYGVFKTILSFVWTDNSSNSQNEWENKGKKTQKNIIQCSRCMTKHYSNSNYCHMCGKKLRK